VNSRARQAVTGVAEACGVLAERHRGHRIGETEDNVQEACLRALQLDQAQIIHRPFHYLKRITRNLFIDRARRRARAVRIFDQVEDLSQFADQAPGPEQYLAGKQLLASVLAEIDQLPPRCRQAFLMHRFENASYPIISRRMGISVSMVEKHIATAMVRLEKVRRSQEGVS
jgi:RNA polymerase sigma factor (sigma-70 family)